MHETSILFSLGNLSVTAYSLCLTGGALLAVLLTVLLGRKTPGVNASLSLCLVTLPMAVLGARLVYCLTMIESILVDFSDGLGFIPRLWEGGFTLYGAVIFGALGVWVYARATHRKAGALMDQVAPGAALMILVERLAEYFTSQGLGDYVFDEGMQRFPFAVQSAYGDWQMPVFLYEALAALVILMVVACLRGAPGRRAETFVILLGLTQILLESWREDEYIRFGFVRFTQLAAVLTVAAVLGARILRRVRAGGWSAWQVGRIVLYLLGVGACIGVEFALDKSSIDNTLLYVVMSAFLVVMGVSVLHDGKKTANTCTIRQEMVQ